MTDKADDFQQRMGEQLLAKCPMDDFRDNLERIKKICTTTSCADDVNDLLNYLYDEARSAPEKPMGYPVERQFRAAVALWELANDLPDVSAEKDFAAAEYKKTSLGFALDLLSDAMCDDGNPYLRDYATKILENPPKL